MKCLLSVCLTMLAGTAIFAVGGGRQALQKGISVQMARSSHASPMPEADRENAWIVTIAAGGQLYFGTDEVTADGLTEQMKIHPRERDARLYVKADSRAPFRSVRQVLRAARVDLFDEVVLLSSQPEAERPRTVVPPEGLEVWIGDEVASNLVTVQIEAGQQALKIKVNNDPIDSSALQSRLAQLFDNRTGRIVILKASGAVPYARVVQAIDASRAAGASRITMVVAPEV